MNCTAKLLGKADHLHQSAGIKEYDFTICIIEKLDIYLLYLIRRIKARIYLSYSAL